MLYEIYTKDKMFTQAATYFVADKSGVMFFDTEDKGIAFVPNFNLLFVRESKKAKDDEAARKAIADMGWTYDATKGLVKNAS